MRLLPDKQHGNDSKKEYGFIGFFLVFFSVNRVYSFSMYTRTVAGFFGPCKILTQHPCPMCVYQHVSPPYVCVCRQLNMYTKNCRVVHLIGYTVYYPYSICNYVKNIYSRWFGTNRKSCKTNEM